MSVTSIEWADKVWNCIRGCSLKSEGCRECYAMKTAHRFDYPGGTYEGLTETGSSGPRWNGKVRLVEEKLTEPLHWKKPAKIFVNSMSDCFHDDVPFEFLDKMFAVMALCPQHVFQILTKRPERMREYFGESPELNGMTRDALVEGEAQSIYAKRTGEDPSMWLAVHWPLPNVWLGISAEDQQRFDERIDDLLKTPAAVRFVSYEPMLGPLDAEICLYVVPRDAEGPEIPRIDWLIAGSESGSGARPAELDWFRSVRDQCLRADVPFFLKQFAVNGKKQPLPRLDGHQWMEFPR